MTLLGGALVLIFGLFYCNDTSSSPKSPQSQETLETEEVFKRFKSYLDRKVESIASGLAFHETISRWLFRGRLNLSSGGIQKLEKAAEAGKLKFQGKKDQFLFNSELQRTLDDTANVLGHRESRREGGRTEGKSTPSSKDYQAW